MKLTSLVLLSAAAALAQPVVSNVRILDLSHSSVTVSWSNSSDWGRCRVRYGATTSYEGGSLGGIFELGNYGVHEQFGVENQISGCSVNLYNLKAAQLYHVCPQTTTDNGMTWSACVDTSFSTLPLPSIHPAYPISPAQFSTAYPDTSGYSSVTVAADCGDLQSKLTTAAAAQVANGTIIRIPVGTNCTGAYILPADSSVKSFPAAAIQTSTNQITHNAHGFSDQQKVRLAIIAGSGTLNMAGRWALVPGKDYYIKLMNLNTYQLSATPGGPAIDFAIGAVTVDAATDIFTVDYDNHGIAPDGTIGTAVTRIQFKSTGTLPAPLTADTNYWVLNPGHSMRSFQVSLTQGGPPLNITTVGTGTHFITYPGNATYGIMAWPPATSNKIIIRSAAADSTLPPPGVRTSPQWRSQNAIFKNVHADNQPHPVISSAPLAHGYRIGPGIEFTTADTATAEIQSSTNPGIFFNLFGTDIASHDIIFDRMYVHAAPFPNRIYRGADWNGSNQAIVDSYFDELNNWHGGYRLPTVNGVTSGMVSSVLDTSHVTWTAGTLTVGNIQVTFPHGVIATIRGRGVSGLARVWFNLATRKLVFDMPNGSSVTSVEGYPDWVSQNEAAPQYPLTPGFQQYAVLPNTDITLTAGSVTATADLGEDPAFGEGTQFFVAGNGPGPYLFQNTYFSSTGIPMHFDDSNAYFNYANTGTISGIFCGPYYPADITVRRSYFTSAPFTLFGKPGTDGNRYYNRNAFEIKNGARGLLEGNVFERQFADVAFIGTGVVIQAQRCGESSDWEVRYNTIRDSGTGILVMGSIPSRSPVAPTGRRLFIHDNFFYGIDGTAYETGNYSIPVNSNAVVAAYGGEDYRMQHNTSVSALNGIVHFQDTGWEGFRMADNFMFKASAILNTEATVCDALVDKDMADCLLFAGTGVPAYEWKGNIVQGSATTLTPTVTTTDPKFADPVHFDFRLNSSNSPLLSRFQTASDGGNVGADAGAISRAQGQIQNVTAVNITRNTALITGSVSDAGAACTVGYGTGLDVTAWNRSAPDTTNGPARSIGLTGLMGGTLYNYQLWCAGTTPTPTQQFSTTK